LLIDKSYIAGINSNIGQFVNSIAAAEIADSFCPGFLEAPSGILLRDAGLHMSKGETENGHL
jgi:hypothetical protein